MNLNEKQIFVWQHNSKLIIKKKGKNCIKIIPHKNFIQVIIIGFCVLHMNSNIKLRNNRPRTLCLDCVLFPKTAHICIASSHSTSNRPIMLWINLEFKANLPNINTPSDSLCTKADTLYTIYNPNTTRDHNKAQKSTILVYR